MAILNIAGNKVTVDDSFLKLPPDQQNATVEEIAKSLAVAPSVTSVQPAPQQPLDQYQSAAVQERDSLKSKGIDTGAGVTRRAIQGATFNTADEIIAAASTPFEMFKRGTWDPREGYKYAKAREDLILDDSKKDSGYAGTAAELAGGLVSGTSLARAGATAGRFLGQGAGILPRSAAAAADAAVMGSVAGAAEGNSAGERLGNAAQGFGIGGLVGGVTPGAVGLLKGVASPFVSYAAARSNPEGYARNQIARALMESSRTPSQVASEVGQAAREGQGMFTLADAMGNPGQRMLSAVTRSPGVGRTEAVEFLDGRQAGQGRRIANALMDGFVSPDTGAQTQARLTAQRGAVANAEYGAVRNASNPVDLVGTINHLDRTIGTQPGQVLTPANDSIEAVLTPFRQRLARINPDDFEAVQRVRGDMADAAQNAAQSGHGNRARLIRGAVGELDAAMESASTGYRQANRNFAQASRNIEAVDQGRAASMRGRTEDIIPQYQGLPAEAQQAFRAGYVDPLVESAQSAAYGANKARPLTNFAFQDEAAAIAPLNPLMQRRIARENTMFETRQHATGGSRTADNLADEGAMGVDPSMIANMIMGNWGGAARGALQAGRNALTGNTPEVRAEVGRMLTSRGANVSPQELQQVLQQAVDRVRSRQLAEMLLGRGAAGALADVPSATGRR